MDALQRRSRAFFLTLAIPLNLNSWIPVPLTGGAMPEITQLSDELTLKTNDTAGGYGFMLPLSQKITAESARLKGEWRVSHYPSVDVSKPFTQATDDFALRVGLLLSDGTSKIRPRGRLSEIIEKTGKPLTAVLFYSPLPKASECQTCPYDQNILMCFSEAGSEWVPFSFDPYQDLRKQGIAPENLEVIGIWIVADSDNSDSKSEASLRNLSWEGGESHPRKLNPGAVQK